MIEYRFRHIVMAGIASALMAATVIVATDPVLAAGGQGATQANLNPGVIPNRGKQYPHLAADWFLWALSFPAADVPFFNAGGPVDVSLGQQGHVWFLAGSNVGPVTRTADVPTGVSLFFPLANLINDFPCPDPNFKPDPGETMEQFLVRTAQPYLQLMTGLFAEIDGVAVRNPEAYLATSSLFVFTADPALTANFDPCITGSPQPAIATGYWLLLPPLPPGKHELHFGSIGWGQDVRYKLMVKPGHGH